MRFPVNLQRDGKFIMVTFPDIPEAITQGRNEQEAMRQAQDALESALEFYFDDHRPVPHPGRLKRNQRFIELPVSLAAKVLLLNEMLHQKVRPAELARRLHVTPQEVTRLVDLRHTTKIDSIAAALKTLGKNLAVSTSEAA